MELLFVVLIAATLGLVVHYLVRGRETFGAALLPAISTSVSAVVWVALLWLGWRFDGTWIWVASLVIGSVVALIVGLRIPPARRAADVALYATLAGTKA